MAKARLDVEITLVMRPTKIQGEDLVAGDFIVKVADHLIPLQRAAALEAIKAVSKEARTMLGLSLSMSNGEDQKQEKIPFDPAKSGA